MAAPSNLPQGNVYAAAVRYRRELLAREQAAVDDTVRRYLAARHQIELELDALVQRILTAMAAGKKPTIRRFGETYGPDEFSASWLYRVARLEQLDRAIEGELAVYNQTGLQKIQARVQAEATFGGGDATSLLRFRVRDDGLVAPRQFAQLPVGALEQITSFVSATGPVPKAFRGMSTELIQLVQQSLVDGLARGDNPSVIARRMKGATEEGGILDRPLYEQLRVARTEPMRAYREAGRLTYRANSDIVLNWEWHAFPGPRTCPYCLAMDGSIHPLDEPMATHPQCRCTELPTTELSEGPQFTGARYLYELDADAQDEVFGSHTLGELYRGGKVRLSDIPEQYDHQDWGRVGRAASMKSLMQRGIIDENDIVAARAQSTGRPDWRFVQPSPQVRPYYFQPHARRA